MKFQFKFVSTGEPEQCCLNLLSLAMYIMYSQWSSYIAIILTLLLHKFTKLYIKINNTIWGEYEWSAFELWAYEAWKGETIVCWTALDFLITCMIDQ
jgi:hypothetical protein